MIVNVMVQRLTDVFFLTEATVSQPLIYYRFPPEIVLWERTTNTAPYGNV